ncbi:MAG: hypothetical protein LQ339_002455 [Xanthoria mediterranea]|nr:MAG: hypothetical protein LQ339_002455 [Xanthoria mediterranea]
MRLPSSISCWALALAVPLGLVVSAPARPSPNGETNHRRTVFFVGGRYVFNETTKSTNAVDQMYVEQLTPERGVRQPHPLIFLHGGGLTGLTWLNTPDNRKGWASYFLEQGYLVHLIDITNVGRSSRPPSTPSYLPTSVESAEQVFASPEKFPETYPQARLHTQWPGRGLRGDPVFDTWYKGIGPNLVDNEKEEESTTAALCSLLAQIGPSYIFSHSYTGIIMFVVADRCPELIQGLYGVEPAAFPFESRYIFNQPIPSRKWGITDVPVTYHPPVRDPVADLKKITVGENTPGNVSCILQAAPAKRLVNISKVPVAMYTAEASIHIVNAHCLAAYLWQSGVSLDWILLAERGIRGNGHFSFLEKNNLEIAQKVVLPWLQLQSGPNGHKQKKPKTAES